MIDALRCCKLALDSIHLIKKTDDEAHTCLEKFIRGE